MWMERSGLNFINLTIEQAKETSSEPGTAVFVAEREPASMEYVQNPTVADCKGFAFVAAQKVNVLSN